jgi:acetyl esterase/lipase
MPARCEPCIYLWDGDAPGSEGQTAAEQVQVRYPGFRPGWQGDAAGERIISQIHRPSITPFFPPSYSVVAPAAAVLLIPGGGHQANCFDLEGTFVGRWLAERGVAAFVLKYRLSQPFGEDAPASPYELIHSVLDTERAMRLIRHHASAWHIDPLRVGVAGFSAGGYPAAHACMRSGAPASGGVAAAADPIDRQPARPGEQGISHCSPLPLSARITTIEAKISARVQTFRYWSIHTSWASRHHQIPHQRY